MYSTRLKKSRAYLTWAVNKTILRITKGEYISSSKIQKLKFDNVTEFIRMQSIWGKKQFSGQIFSLHFVLYLFVNKKQVVFL